MTVDDPRALLRAAFAAAVAAADPELIVPRHLPPRPPPGGRTVVIGAGKASAAMARAFDAAWDGPLDGVVVTRTGHAVPCGRIRVMEAAHPMPDAAGLAATAALRAAVRGLEPDDLVVALVSGGGSALLPAPPPCLTLADKQEFTAALLGSGLGIGDMNLLRKHVSTVKGGRLALDAWPARVVTLVLSDIPGDNPAHVASGPTVPDGATRADALALLARSGLVLPPAVRRHLDRPDADAPDPRDDRFGRNEVRVIGSATASLEAAAAAVRARWSVAAAVLSDRIEAESRDAGRVLAAIAGEVARRGRPFAPPVVLLSGGETAVTLRDGRAGRGGRNGEFALAAALALDGVPGVHLLAGDSDGIDGSEDNAGAFADGTTADRLRARGLDGRALLDAHDSWTAFETLDDLLVTGPTLTNVNDVRAILIDP